MNHVARHRLFVTAIVVIGHDDTFIVERIHRLLGDQPLDQPNFLNANVSGLVREVSPTFDSPEFPRSDVSDPSISTRSDIRPPMTRARHTIPSRGSWVIGTYFLLSSKLDHWIPNSLEVDREVEVATDDKMKGFVWASLLRINFGRTVGSSLVEAGGNRSTLILTMLGSRVRFLVISACLTLGIEQPLSSQMVNWPILLGQQCVPWRKGACLTFLIRRR
ncbi:hypothetical protein QYF36_015678 [Acer negundo]|nr:hypothetical protein QYF36_015678 [Acer negundo]